MIDLSGKWETEYKNGDVSVSGTMYLPGIMQNAGFGNPVNKETEFVSSLHDPDWFLWDEFACDEINVNVPFLLQPRRHFVGVCNYSVEFEVTEDLTEDHFLFIEVTRRESKVYLDGCFAGGDESLCAPHIIRLGKLFAGVHKLTVSIDNTLGHKFRPDAHTVSDSVGASWNGMVGEIALLSETEIKDRYKRKHEYAENHKRNVEVKDGNFYVDGKPEYMRGTHFGGEFPITGAPSTDKEYYLQIFNTLKDWGFNMVRCHSWCPPEAAFAAADECEMFLLIECGMWSTFGEGFEVIDFLKSETRKILKEFGHHPSFIMFSPSNEPGGNWYRVLRNWVSFAQNCDEALGYEGRRVYTAQSGWYYDTPPAYTEGTDFLYFHRSAYGPLKGGTVRNPIGWKGKNYSPSLEGAKLPVICHELGQWCAYPDFDMISKFTGFLKPGNYEAFKRLAERNGLLPYAKEMHFASGKNQLRLLKEEFEANYRTKELKGYEYLDAHDYPGQGSAFVGILNQFFEPKAYADRDFFRAFNSEVVLTAAFSSYVVKQGDEITVPISISVYGDDLPDKFNLIEELSLEGETVFKRETEYETVYGAKTDLEPSVFTIQNFEKTRILKYKLSVNGKYENSWNLFAVKELKEVRSDSFVECRSFNEVFSLLAEGKDVLFLPHLSELNYDCTPASVKNSFWNAQMGPKWERTNGMIMDTECPVFKDFPTDKTGGFQWESVFDAGRCLVIPPEFKPIVRVIDDWNRNIPEAFLLEAKVGKGRILMAAFDPSNSEKPENKLFYTALVNYISSKDFNPVQSLTEADLRKMYFPVNRMEGLVSGVKLLRGENPSELTGFIDPNPNIVSTVEGAVPSLELFLNGKHIIKGFKWLSNQRKRIRDDFAKRVKLSFFEGEEKTLEEEFDIKNTVREQELLLSSEVCADRVILEVLETYGREFVPFYDEREDGFVKIIKKKQAKVSVAIFHFITDEAVEGSDIKFWEKHSTITTKEIDA